MENKKINKDKILKLWEKFKKKEQSGTEYYPLLYPEFKINCDVLFVGINPSFPEKKNKEDYSYTEGNNFDKEKDIEREKNAKDESSTKRYARYFSPIWKIVKELKISRWDHIDMFLVRETNQEKLKDYIGYKKEKDGFSKFGEEQFKIFKKIIEIINPQVIVIINAFASDIIKDKLKVDDSKFEEEGFYKISINNKDTPLILSGYMGSGRLDKHSHRTLIWIIKKAYILSKK